jgi:anti-sigma B factor antagonist
LTIREETQGDVVVLALTGSFMGEPEASLFQEKKFQLLEKNKNRIVLDLRGLKMANSFGLGNMISAMVSARNAGGDLRLAGLTGDVERVVKTMELTRVFKVFESVEQAVTSFTPQQS